MVLCKPRQEQSQIANGLFACLFAGGLQDRAGDSSGEIDDYRPVFPDTEPGLQPAFVFL